MLKQILDPYRTRAYPEPPNFSLSSTPADELHKHLENLNAIRDHNLHAVHNWGRLVDFALYALGIVFLVAVLWRMYL